MYKVQLSTKDQKENGTSIETQSEAELIIGLDMGLILPEGYHIQEDWTGKDLNRPGLLKLYSLAESELIDAGLIYSQDRLYRPEEESDDWRIFPILERFQNAGVEVEWVDPTVPSKGPMTGLFTFLDP